MSRQPLLDNVPNYGVTSSSLPVARPPQNGFSRLPAEVMNRLEGYLGKKNTSNWASVDRATTSMIREAQKIQVISALCSEGFDRSFEHMFNDLDVWNLTRLHRAYLSMRDLAFCLDEVRRRFKPANQFISHNHLDELCLIAMSGNHRYFSRYIDEKKIPMPRFSAIDLELMLMCSASSGSLEMLKAVNREIDKFPKKISAFSLSKNLNITSLRMCFFLLYWLVFMAGLTTSLIFILASAGIPVLGIVVASLSLKAVVPLGMLVCMCIAQFLYMAFITCLEIFKFFTAPNSLRFFLRDVSLPQEYIFPELLFRCAASARLSSYIQECYGYDFDEDSVVMGDLYRMSRKLYQDYWRPSAKPPKEFFRGPRPVVEAGPSSSQSSLRLFPEAPLGEGRERVESTEAQLLLAPGSSLA